MPADYELFQISKCHEVGVEQVFSHNGCHRTHVKISSIGVELADGREVHCEIKKFYGYDSDYIAKCQIRITQEIGRKRILLDLLKERLLTSEEYIIIEPPSKTLPETLFVYLTLLLGI